MKKISLAALIAATSISAYAYDFEDKGIYYNVISQDELTCEVTCRNGYGDGSYTGEVQIPATATGNGATYTVTAVGELAFNFSEGLTGVTIPQTVEEIGNEAFWSCTALAKVNIPDKVKVIGNSAFGHCESLNTLDMGSSVEQINDEAFTGCTGLTSVSLPASLREIGNNLFEGCTNLDVITLDGANPYFKSIEGILYNAEESELLICPKTKTSVTIPATVESIGVGAFSSCTMLSSVSIPNSVTYIKDGAFSGCTALSTITLSNALETIGGWAFYASGLTVVTIPASVQKIGDYAFGSCYSLTAINVDPASLYFGSADGILYDKNVSTLLTCPPGKTSATIANTATAIAPYAFESTKIESVEIPASVTEIGEYAFFWCERLKEIAIPNSVTEIKNSTFYGCIGLTKVTLPSSLKKIGSDAFNSCEALKVVYSFNPEPPVVDEYAWPGTYNRATLYVPQGSLTAYKNATGWSNFKTIEEFDPTGIAGSTADNVKIYSSEDGITVCGANNGERVSIYNVDGQLVSSSEYTGSPIEFYATKGHVYIVKVGDKSVKIVR